jgi:hypothetical protein
MIVLGAQNSTTPADSSMWNGHSQHHQNHNQQDGQYKNDSLDVAKSNNDEDKDGIDRNNKSISSDNHDDDDGNDDDSLDSNGMIKENKKDSNRNNKTIRQQGTRNMTESTSEKIRGVGCLVMMMLLAMLRIIIWSPVRKPLPSTFLSFRPFHNGPKRNRHPRDSIVTIVPTLMQQQH